MNAYLVERYLPGVSESELRSRLGRVEALCRELSAEGTEIHYAGSIFLPLEESCFCRFECERPETVAEINQRAQLAYARITAGIAITPEVNVAPEPTNQPSEVQRDVNPI